MGEQADEDGDGDGDGDVADDRPTAAVDGHGGDEQGEQHQCVGAHLPQRVEDVRQRLDEIDDRRDEAGERLLGEGQGEQAQRRGDERDDVAGPPGAGLVGVGGEQPWAAVHDHPMGAGGRADPLLD